MTPTPEKKHPDYLDKNKDSVVGKKEIHDALSSLEHRKALVEKIDVDLQQNPELKKILLPEVRNVLEDLRNNPEMLAKLKAGKFSENSAEKWYLGVLFLYSKLIGKGESGHEKQQRETQKGNNLDFLNRVMSEYEVDRLMPSSTNIGGVEFSYTLLTATDWHVDVVLDSKDQKTNLVLSFDKDKNLTTSEENRKIDVNGKIYTLDQDELTKQISIVEEVVIEGKKSDVKLENVSDLLPATIDGKATKDMKISQLPNGAIDVTHNAYVIHFDKDGSLLPNQTITKDGKLHTLETKAGNVEFVLYTSEKAEKSFEKHLEDELNPDNHMFFEWKDTIFVLNTGEKASDLTKKITALEKSFGNKKDAVAAVDILIQENIKDGTMKSVWEIYTTAINDGYKGEGVMLDDLTDKELIAEYLYRINKDKPQNKKQNIQPIRARMGSGLVKALTQFDFARVKTKEISEKHYPITQFDKQQLENMKPWEKLGDYMVSDLGKELKEPVKSELGKLLDTKEANRMVKTKDMIVYKDEKGIIKVLEKAKEGKNEKPVTRGEMWAAAVVGWVVGSTFTLIIDRNWDGIKSTVSWLGEAIKKAWDGLGNGLKDMLRGGSTTTTGWNVVPNLPGTNNPWGITPPWTELPGNNTSGSEAGNVVEQTLTKLGINNFWAGALIGAMATSIPLKMKIARMETEIAIQGAKLENKHSLQWELITSGRSAELINKRFKDADTKITKWGEKEWNLSSSNLKSLENPEANEIWHAMLVKSKVFEVGQVTSLAVAGIDKTENGGFRIALSGGEGKGVFVYKEKKFQLKKWKNLFVDVDANFTTGSFSKDKDEKIFKRWALGKSRSVEDVIARVDGKETTRQERKESKKAEKKEKSE